MLNALSSLYLISLYLSMKQEQADIHMKTAMDKSIQSSVQVFNTDWSLNPQFSEYAHLAQAPVPELSQLQTVWETAGWQLHIQQQVYFRC